MRLLKHPWMQLPVLWTIVTLLIFAQNPNEPVQSGPPDTTPYSRDAIPADVGRLYDEAHGFVRDVVVSNTDPNLAHTDVFNDGETSIAIDPENPNHIVISAFSADGVPMRRSGTHWMAGTPGPSNSRFLSRRECRQSSAVLATKHLTMVIVAD
jgi:hypothetical protein